MNVGAVIVQQGFGDEARIRKTYTISEASRKSKNLCTNIEKCKKQRLKNVNNKVR